METLYAIVGRWCGRLARVTQKKKKPQYSRLVIFTVRFVRTDWHSTRTTILVQVRDTSDILNGWKFGLFGYSKSSLYMWQMLTLSIVSPIRACYMWIMINTKKSPIYLSRIRCAIIVLSASLAAERLCSQRKTLMYDALFNLSFHTIAL